MADIEKSVKEVIEDLNKKIEDLTNVGDCTDAETLAKVNEVKEKAISVLNLASKKVVDTAKDIADSEEVEKGIEIVKVKSKDLYDKAMIRINEIIGKENVNNIKEDINDVADGVKDIAQNVKSDINDFFEKEEVKNAINNAKDTTVDIAEKALDTLRAWLKPEE